MSAARAVEIDPDALLEIELGFAGNHAGKMKNHIRPAGDGGARGGRIGNIGGRAFDFAGEFFRLLRRAHIAEREPLDRPAVKRAVVGEARDELAADHPGRAGNQNVHGDPSRDRLLTLWPCALASPYSAIPPSTRCAWPVM